MRSGFYIATRDRVLTTAAPKAAYRARIRRGDWLVTDGYWVGRFDKENFDWYPLEWIRNNPVTLDEDVEPQLVDATSKVPISRLEKGFQDLVFVEEGEPMPDMPLPSMNQLGSYLKARRTMVAYTYDRR